MGDASGQEFEQKSPLEARKELLQRRLASSHLHPYTGKNLSLHSLVNEWVGLGAKFDSAVEQAKKGGLPIARVIQHAEAATQDWSQKNYANVFLKKLGAHIDLEGKRVDVSVQNIPSIVENQSIPQIQTADIENSQGPARVDTPSGDLNLIVDTDIEGVRIWMDGALVSGPAEKNPTLRPMLLVKVS